ncbi:serine hydrolase domain-containing protein [Steroidobacter sp.]|uniref:serine hydrolase domain-containing protein n=1 Tax=Steroidobacter sp. TaxID=1978227 RepID=UPI001A471034|nr:serine hydrolase domain-containing protein [Steroidobacter sp.]MBL8267164.1 beta-lactamase family protein [Steroidobacter sp.]
MRMMWLLFVALIGSPLHAVAASSSPAATIDALLDETDWRGRPGLAVGVFHHGKPVYVATRGTADLEHGSPVTARTVFNVASVSKHVTAYAVLLLVRDGKLQLDDDVRKYLPGVPDFGESITIRQLIFHTSGLREEGNLFIMAGRVKEDYRRQQQVLNLVAAQRALNFAPGTDHLYSNTNYVLLAQLVSKVSGRSFRQFTSERIFAPLGMTQSFFRDDIHELIPGKANSYGRDATDRHWRSHLDNHDLLGSINLFTTVHDMLLWAGNLSRPTVGDDALVAQLLEMGRLNDGTALGYGYGLTPVVFAGHEGKGHGGWTAEFRADFNYFPRDDFAVVILRNSNGDTAALNQAIVRAWLGDAGGKPLVPLKATLSAAQIEALEGHYLAAHGPLITLQRSGADIAITIRSYGLEAATLNARVDGTLDVNDSLRAWNNFLTPLRDPQGRVTALRESNGGGRRDEIYQRVSLVTPSPRELAALAGNYRSDELDITYRIAVEHGRLVVNSLWMTEALPLSPTAQDQFESPEWWLQTVQFKRDANDAVTGFAVHAGRVRNVFFTRVDAASR